MSANAMDTEPRHGYGFEACTVYSTGGKVFTAPAVVISMSIPPSLLSLNGNSEVVRDHEMRRAMKANVVDKMAVTPRLDLWGPLEHYP